MEKSSILFHNPEETVFLIDVPASITLAQELSSLQLPHYQETANQTAKKREKRYLLSTAPLKTPYPVTTEPKTDVARARVLGRIPVSEQDFRAEIEPVVHAGLGVICEGRKGSDWCLPRHEISDELSSGYKSTDLSGVCLKKRKADYEITDTSVDELALKRYDPPVILSASCQNNFGYISELHGLVKNTSLETAVLGISESEENESDGCVEAASKRSNYCTFSIPPLSNFVLCTIPLTEPCGGQARGTLSEPIPGLSENHKFNLILMDPPWSNRSVRRSRQYQTHSYSDMDVLAERMRDILQVHLYDHTDYDSKNIETQIQQSIAAIWITNSAKARRAAYDAIQGAGLEICEEWVWVKTTSTGESITPLDGLWRKPYEILVIGEKRNSQNPSKDITRRVIAAVPDVHSRKPNLREIFEKLFFRRSSCDPIAGMPYTALEVFARNLTAGLWSCGNEALKFNADEWWVVG